VEVLLLTWVKLLTMTVEVMVGRKGNIYVNTARSRLLNHHYYFNTLAVTQERNRSPVNFVDDVTHGGALQKHLLIHSGVKEFVCQTCGKTFNRNGNLQQHLLTHTGVKSFICEVCEKSFAQNSHLKTHLLIHANTKDHTCSECSSSFRKKSDLKVHFMRKHTNIRPHVCQCCGKGHVMKRDLKQHMKTHSDIGVGESEVNV